jgi:sugar phosphate isomerase/epimerase
MENSRINLPPRRKWIKQILPITLASALAPMEFALSANSKKTNPTTPNLKLSLNAYSFNTPLIKQELSLHELFDFCAKAGFQAVDLTAYYLSGYPRVPKDSYLFEVKRDAHRFGLHISGTGVRNDFTYLSYDRRKQEVQLVKDWVVAASKLGAPVLRVFSGTQKVAPADRKQVWNWMVADFKECASFGAEYGVIVALQNHNDFIQTADEVNQVMEEVNSPWFGLVLDIGSYPVEAPYEGIAKNIQHAVNWQIKERINHFGEQRPVDLAKLMTIVTSSNYQGYLPIETLGAGDPFEKVSDFLDRVRGAFKEFGIGEK